MSTYKIRPIWLRQKDQSFWANWAIDTKPAKFRKHIPQDAGHTRSTRLDIEEFTIDKEIAVSQSPWIKAECSGETELGELKVPDELNDIGINE